MRAAIIPADRTRPIRIEDINADLAALQGIVGGYIQQVSIPAMDAVMYVDEEAAMKSGSTPNGRATALVMAYNGMNTVLLGDVVLLGWPDGDGNETALPAPAVAVLESVFADGA